MLTLLICILKQKNNIFLQNKLRKRNIIKINVVYLYRCLTKKWRQHYKCGSNKMKTLKENTSDFLNEVKFNLDNANWDFEACDPRADYSDVSKAISYLETQSFSISKIKIQLALVWIELLEQLRTYHPDNICDMEYNAKYAACMIANDLGFQRIAKFQKSYWDYKSDSKKWHINETVHLKIN